MEKPRTQFRQRRSQDFFVRFLMKKDSLKEMHLRKCMNDIPEEFSCRRNRIVIPKLQSFTNSSREVQVEEQRWTC